jgi:protein-disulfide isomerase
VTVIELGDFECPYCKSVSATMGHMANRYGDDLRIVWMNFPLPFHKNARPAANAALEAQAQRGNDAFWALHDEMFANQTALDAQSLRQTAEAIGLDGDQIAAAIAEDRYGSVIDAQDALAKRLGARGTPTFFINGRILRGSQPMTRFALLIEEELSTAKALVAQGVPRSKLYQTLTAKGIAEAKPAPAPSQAAPAPTPSKVYDIPLPKKPRAKGPANAKVVIQEFSDFQCPVCARVVPTLERVLEEYGDDVRIVYRDYPLSFHADAHLAAQAAREVFAQKGNAAFWKYHDLLLSNQRALSREHLETYAGRIGGVNMKAFRNALDSGKHRAAVDADMRAVARAGARIGTPAFFINGKLAIQGRPPFETFKAAIDAEL